MHAPEDWKIRYAQCWEDADVLLEALDIRPGQFCVSIASGGDNTLAMLARNPGRVLALDVNPAQLACLELRVAAFRTLSHEELLELMGSTPSARRGALYKRCRSGLSGPVRRFWDGRPDAVASGIGGAGKFERYLSTFRRRVLPLIHSRRTVEKLLAAKDPERQKDFYEGVWDTWRWRLLFRVFFSHAVMRMGRGPHCFRYVDGNVSARILERMGRALSSSDATASSYLEWILTGRHRQYLPFSLRSENFEIIRRNLDRLEWRSKSFEEYLGEAGAHSVDAFNLSDIFEYASFESYERLLRGVIGVARRGARIAYWNVLAPRSRPESMAYLLAARRELAERLKAHDKAFFYGAFVIEEAL